ncbi:type I methionyl aminopeptidase [Candidatus Collierbacteria bacterium CG17_big_fil_post_rev_8_21_14_2_50_45_7]|uniref:Methionine aminopeptidase n=2 Tax=Candidatus Collieribacteriota TaxID=1752725 RepID=A0A2H0X1C2_9BACT|nr:MAG: type I methionyl aminopeptidase [Candidatus Collierbacteria bacterium CG09_land_8_20_14_0_10_46_12]PIW06833.1 MAG: type I methionyl aminopeptidase [Candidatus Collierbacteria bacterium CG17_big_fil_post_rev_8_21_14_2_50_45_7]
MNKIEAMKIGGAMLGRVRQALYTFTTVGVTPKAIEFKARQLIKAEGGELSFTKVPTYRWATCININDGIVHGIPESTIPLKDGDLVTVDVGVYYKGFHTDCAFSKVVGTSSPAKDRFLKAGLEGLQNALNAIKAGGRIGEISLAMESTLKKYGYSATAELTGHGVGQELHEDPMISNVVLGPREQTPVISVGQTLAIEIIYVQGKPSLILEEDGWTISVKDGTLSAVHEETVLVTEDGCSILTVPSLFQIV